MWNQLKTILFLGGLTALAVAAASAFAPSWAFAIAAIAVLFNAAMYFWSDRLVLRMHRARELSRDEAPALHAINDRLAAAADIPTPRLYLIEAGYANAFATGRGPGHAAIAVTSGLLAQLTTRELQGVMAHEMAHVANRDVLIASVAAGLAAIVGAVANAVQFSALFGSTSSSADEEQSSPVGALAFALVAPLAATLVQLAISRSREYVADATAARLTGDPEALASALARLSRAAHDDVAAAPAPATASLFIVNPLAGATGLMALLSTHPPMEQRIARLLRLARRPLRAA
jgi:heat shock protein HtpX